MESQPRKPYPTDVGDNGWAFVAPYLALMRADAPQRTHDPREASNALRWIVRAGGPWRLLPHEFPPWQAVYQQARRWIEAGCFEEMVHDLRAMLRWGEGRADDPTAVVLDARTVQSTPESGAGAGWDGHKRRRGRQIHLAVDTLGHLLALRVTPANGQERAQVAELTAAVQEATGQRAELANVDQGHVGDAAAAAAAAHGLRPGVVKLPEARRGFVVLPRRLARDYERLPETIAGLHFVASACLMLHRLVSVVAPSP